MNDIIIHPTDTSNLAKYLMQREMVSSGFLNQKLTELGKYLSLKCSSRSESVTSRRARLAFQMAWTTVSCTSKENQSHLHQQP